MAALQHMYVIYQRDAVGIRGIEQGLLVVI